MTTKNKERLCRLVTTFILDHGGAVNENGDLVIDTTGGILIVSPMGDWIAGRFVDVDKAKTVLGCRQFYDRLSPTGKWMFVFGKAASPFYCFDKFQKELAPLLQPAGVLAS